MDKKKREKKVFHRIKHFISWVIIILLIIICIICSFYSGKKFFELSNTQFGGKDSMIQVRPAKWHFESKIIVGGQVYE